MYNLLKENRAVMLLVILSLCVPFAYGQTSIFGSCPTVNAVENFDPIAFAGRWYEIERFRSFPSSIFRSSCKTVEFDYDEDKDGFDVIFESYSFFFGLQTVTATARITDPKDKDGSLTLNLPGRLSTTPTPFDYYILATDYENYAVVSMCRNSAFITTQNLWILSRTRTLANDFMILARMHAYAQKFNVFALSRTDQSICPLI